MKIVSKVGTEMLEINVDGPSEHLNPFIINIEQIRYIREYEYEDKSKGWAIVVGGNKFFPTKDLDFSHVNTGDIIKIGNIDFACVIATALTGKNRYKTMVNRKQIVYLRKFVDGYEQNKKSNKNDIAVCGNLDTFAIVWDNDRIMPIISK